MTTTAIDPLARVLLATARLEQACQTLLEQVQGQPPSLDTPSAQQLRAYLWSIQGMQSYLAGLASPDVLETVKKSARTTRTRSK
jgi:hypothetical protein